MEKSEIAKIVARTEKTVADLEHYFANPTIDDHPCVVVMKGSSATSALKILSDDSFNMAGMGLEASTFSRVKANKIANEFGHEVMNKYDFYKKSLETSKNVLEMLKPHLA